MKLFRYSKVVSDSALGARSTGQHSKNVMSELLHRALFCPVFER